MKYITETFYYEVPNDCEDFITIEDYILAANEATCPFYNDYDGYIPNWKRDIIIKS